MFLYDQLQLGVYYDVVQVVVTLELRCSCKKLPNFVRTRCEHVVGALFAKRSFSDELILTLVDLPL